MAFWFAMAIHATGRGANRILSGRRFEDMGGTPMPRGMGVPPVSLSARAKSDLRPRGRPRACLHSNRASKLAAYTCQPMPKNR